MNDHDGWIRCLSIADKQLYSCSYDNSVKVWDLSLLACVATLSGAQRAESSCVWQKFVFVGYEDGRMRVYPRDESEAMLNLKEHKSAVLALAANKDLVFSGSFDNTINVWGQQLEEDDE